MAKKKAKQGGKVQKVIMIVKAKGAPDLVTVKQHGTQLPEPAPEPDMKAIRRAMRAQPKLPRSKVNITPKRPKLR